MKMLVPSAGVAAARETAEYIMEVALAIDAEVVVLHVVRPGKSKEAGELSLEMFRQAAESTGVPYEGHIREGLVSVMIAEFAEEMEVDLIVMGASNGIVVEHWVSSDVCGMTTVPVVVIPYQIIGD